MQNYSNDDAIVLFSGGQDSTVCLYWAKKHFDNVLAVCINYGQRHSLEVKVAEEIAKKANVEFKLLDALIFSDLATNSLTNFDIQIDKEKPEDSFPNTFVPGRNMIFISYAAAIAYGRGIKHIITGVSEVDYSGYPDCRSEFIRSLNTSLNLAMDNQFIIHTPLMFRDKKQVWALADELAVFDLVRYDTITCYNGLPAEGCGECPACKLRQKGLEEFLETKKM